MNGTERTRNRRTDGQMDRCTKLTDGRNRRTDGQNGRTDGQTGPTDRRTDGRMEQNERSERTDGGRMHRWNGWRFYFKSLKMDGTERMDGRTEGMDGWVD